MKKIVSAFALALLLFASTGCNLLPTMNKPSKQSSDYEESSIVDKESSSSRYKSSSSNNNYSTYNNYSSSMTRPSSSSENKSSYYYSSEPSSSYQPPEPSSSYQPPEPSSSSESSSSSSGYEETTDNNGLAFQLSDDGTYYIVNGLAGEATYYANKKLYIASEYNGLPVKRIAQQAFKGADIGAIVLPESITIIGVGAFEESKITSAYIPSSVETIPFNAFMYSSLKTVELNEGLKGLEQQAFIGTDLKSIVLPSTVEEIGISCFQNCYYLEDVTLNSSLKKINTLAFCRCRSLRTIDIPASVTYMRASFLDCNNITVNIDSDSTSLKIKDGSIMSYDESVLIEFLNKASISEYRVSASVKVIGIYCFAGAKINTIIIENTLDYFEGAAFASSNIKKIIFIGTTEQWNNVICYNGPVENIEVVIDENYDNGN